MQWLEVPNPVRDVQASFITNMAVPMGDTFGTITLTPASGTPKNSIWWISIATGDGKSLLTCSLLGDTPELAKKAANDFLWKLGNQFRQTSFELGMVR